MKVYIAGPMRGIEAFNFPAFDRAAERLQADGHEVFSPAERDRREDGFDGYRRFACAIAHTHGPKAGCVWPRVPYTGNEDLSDLGFSLRDAMADDMTWIATEAEAIYLLKGWEKSAGAKAEKALAEALGLEIMFEVGPNVVKREWALPNYSEALAQGLDRDLLNGRLQESIDSLESKREFDTGATRDSNAGKYEYARFFDPKVLEARAAYMTKHRKMRDGSLREPDNWKKGMPVQTFMDGLMRHLHDVWTIHEYGKTVRPEDGEAVDMVEALCAIMFNAEGWLHHLLTKEEPF